MSRYGKVGAFRQVAHPRIRGGLDPAHEQKHYGKVTRLEDYKADEETYFVPSFSIRRHLHRSEEQNWEAHRHALARRLGRSFTTTAVDKITLKSLEQHRFIKNMRQAGIHPNPNEIRDLAYSVRDDLTNLLTNVRSPLPVPLADFGRFGYRKNALAYEIEGWRGDRANYGSNDLEGYRDAHAVLLEERRLAVGAVALAYQENGLQIDGLAPSPHLTIARSNEEIPEYRMRGLNGKLADLAMGQVLLGDPVIQMKLYRDQPAEIIPIKHSWDSLAPDMPELSPLSELSFELADDRYEFLARQAMYA